MSGADDQTPSRVVAGRYRLESVLGRGGMGVVWLAVDTLIERRVALKELRAPTGVAEGDEASFVERAMREARNAGRLNHPAVVAVHDVIAPTGGDDDAVYIVMEYIPSPSLAEVLDDEGPLSEGRVATMGLGILDALMAAHTMGIVHRDIKPGNVLIRDGDRVKLTDFGIALAAEDTRLTRTGVIGTHAYLAPECFDTGHAGPAADLWALGATMFHAVAGRAPFDRATTTETLRAILFEDPPAPPCEPPLAEVITGLLTRSVDERLTSDVARQKLEQVAAEPTTSKSRAEAPPAAGAGQAAWEAQATGLHRPPAATPQPQQWGQPTPSAAPQPGAQSWGQSTQPAAQPSGQSWGHTTQPAAQSWGQPTQAGGQPSPYATAQPTSSPHAGAGQRYGQAGYGYGAAQSQGNPNTPSIIGGAVAVVAVLLLVVVLASGGGGGGGGPDGAVEGLMEAVIDGDCQRAADYVTANFGTECPDNPGFTSLRSVEMVSESGDRAVVQATVTDSGDSEASVDFDVVRIDGDWKVDGLNLDGNGPEVPSS